MYNYKKILGLILVIILSVLIAGLSYLILKNSTSEQKQKENLVSFIKSQKYEIYIPKDRLEKSLTLISNTGSSTETSYEQLRTIAFYMQDAYYKSNDPDIRNLLSMLNDKAKEIFPEQHSEDHFLATCADPDCGEKPDSEVLKILNDIKNLKVDELYTRIISTNLENANYTRYDTSTNKLEKLSLYNLAYLQLLEVNNSEASASAESLRAYVKKKYDKDIGDLESLTQGL